MCIYIDTYEYFKILHTGTPVVIMSYWQRHYYGLDIKLIIVPLFSKSVINMAYLSNEAAVVWYLLLFVHSFQTTDVSTIGHSFKTNNRRTPLFHFGQYGLRRRHYRPRINPPYKISVSSESRTHNLPNSWMEVDKYSAIIDLAVLRPITAL